MSQSEAAAAVIIVLVIVAFSIVIFALGAMLAAILNKSTLRLHRAPYFAITSITISIYSILFDALFAMEAMIPAEMSVALNLLGPIA